MARSENGCIARWLDNKPWVMAGVLLAGVGCEVGAFYLWEESPGGAIALATTGVAGWLLVLRGKILP